MTTYRPNTVTGSILSVEVEPEAPPASTGALDESQFGAAVGGAAGATYKLKWPTARMRSM